ncbi:MAG: PAS domain S-box protein [Desulforhopalus sp.]
MNKHKEICKIVIVYALFGCAWILLSDTVMNWLIKDSDTITRLSIVKGFLFIVTTSILLYYLIARLSSKIRQSTIALRKNEELLHFIVKNSMDTLVIIDSNRKQKYVSPGVEKIFGFMISELEGKPLDTIIHSDDMQHINEVWEEAVKHPDAIVTVQYRHIHKEKGWVFVEAVAQSFLDEPEINGVIASVRDITERKKTEKFLIEGRAKLKGALESMTDAVFISDAEGNFVEFNEAFSTFHRLQGKKECLSALADWPNFLDVYSDDGKLLPLDMWVASRALRGEQGVSEVYKLQRRDTGETWFGSYNFAPIYNNEGGISGSVVVAHDITEKLQIEAKLAQAQKMEAIGTLAGGIAHDFNNILGAILGYAEMVQEDCPSGSAMRNDIDQVVEASHRAKELVKQILAFSRQTETIEQALQPTYIIKEAVKMLRASLPATIDIQLNTEPEVGLILADPTQIHQLLTNLCTNAFHAMEEAGGILTISLKNKKIISADLDHEPHVQPGLFVEISVGDTGPGISPQNINRIFDPFFTTKEVGKGTGMGLAIIHGIAKKSGGFVSCKSSPGEGTIFKVYLPIHISAVQTQDEITPIEVIQPGIENILFIDDEEMLAEMGKSMLERLGYKVTVETNSIEALNTIKNQPNRFDLVITDHTMPGMTGSDLARRMLQIRPGLPIILCTGFSNMISEEKARIYGIKGFALKPLAKKDLASLIRKILDGEK